MPDGATRLDIHHAHHPQTRFNGDNPLSVGFTSHYALMRAEYGGHLANGCAGENILVETQERVTLVMAARGLVIRPANGGELVWLREMQVALPCRPFSGYVMGLTEASVKEALQFLNDGMRGYYCALAEPEVATIAVNDEVLLPEV